VGKGPDAQTERGSELARDAEPARGSETAPDDVLELAPRRRRVPGWLLVVAALVVLGGLARLEQGKSPTTDVTPSPSPTTPSVVQSSPAGTPYSPAPSPVRPEVVELGHPLLGATGDWELFARGSDELVRIQPATGRITRTPVPALNSSGAVSLLVGPDRVVVRPWDFVSGYVVRDGMPARTLPARPGQNGAVYPGPDSSHMWAQSAQDGRVLSLVGLDGARAGAAIALPAAVPWLLASDGTGYLVARGVGGDYVARPDGLRRITTGSVVAIGPTRWLVVECDDRAQCATSVVDRATGSRRRLNGSALPDTGAPPGIIAPDGSQAAVVRSSDGDGPNRWTMHLIDLGSGSDRTVAVFDFSSGFDATMAWSPDSRWLFTVSDGRLVAVDARTRQVRSLEGVLVPPVEQLAVRTTGR
jgi:hypothetical protein